MPSYSLPTEFGGGPLCAPAAERDVAGGRVSSTAAVIAASTVYLAREKRVTHIVPARAAELSELFLQQLPEPRRTFLSQLSAGRLRLLGRFVEETTVPGIQLHYALRKRHIEEVARRFIAEGGQQVVVLGGGFDTLAIRLAEEFPQIRFVEVDQPAMQQIKTRALAQRTCPSNLSFLPLDVTNERFAEALARHSAVSTTERSLFIAEGLLMYLTADAVEALFAALRNLSPSGSFFVFTFMERDACGRVTFRKQAKVVDFWLRLRGEAFQWGSRREEIEALVARFGFRVREIVTAAELRTAYLPEAPELRVPEGECVCVAERV